MIKHCKLKNERPLAWQCTKENVEHGVPAELADRGLHVTSIPGSKSALGILTNQGKIFSVVFGNYWVISHSAGDVEVLSDKRFHQRYEEAK